MIYSRKHKSHSKTMTVVKQALSLLAIVLVSFLSVKFVGNSLKPELAVADTQSTKTEKSATASSSTTVAKETTTTTQTTVKEQAKTEASTTASQAAEAAAAPATEVTLVAHQTAPQAQVAPAAGGAIVLANGNSAGAIGTEAAARMAAATGVPQATWEYIIARESNGDPNVANPSGASGLFQTMPGWGSTATVDDQINAALNAYNNQGLAAWGMQ